MRGKGARFGRCAYCGDEGPLTVDHVFPLARAREARREAGVRRAALDNPGNRVLVCRPCNQEKGAMHPREWFTRYPHYARRVVHEARYLSDTIRKLAGLPRRSDK